MKKFVKNSVKGVIGSVVEIIREGDGVAKKKISAKYNRKNNRRAVEEAFEISGDFLLVNNKDNKVVVYYPAA